MAYTEEYESELLRGYNEGKPWDLIHEVKSIINSQDKLLDIGCGTASKLIKIASDSNYKEIIGLEPNKRMRDKAQENVLRSNFENIKIVDGLAENLPFKEDEFDIVTVMVAPHNTTEIYRVLKPGGYAIVEKIGDRDKWDFKILFGKDSEGFRGQFCDYSKGERAIEYKNEFSQKFNSVSIVNGFWKTYYSLEGLMLLFEETPTIRDFNRIQDLSIVNEIEKKYMTEKGIVTTQNRILIKANK